MNIKNNSDLNLEAILGLIKSKKFVEANSQINKLIHISPKSHFLYNLKGIILSNQNKIAESIDCFKKSIKIKPDFAEGYYNLGVILINLERFNESISCLKQSLKINPKNSNAFYNLANAFSKLALSRTNTSILEKTKELNQAKKYYLESIKYKPDYFQAYNNLGIVNRNLGYINEAIKNYKESIKIKNDFASAHYNLGNAQRSIGNLNESIISFENALKIKPDDLETRSNIILFSNYLLNLDIKKHNEHLKNFKNNIKEIDENLIIPYKFQTRKDKLKIGFISGDLSSHPVGFFLKSFLKYLNYNKIELIAYSNSKKEDNITKDLKKKFSAWHTVNDVKDVDLINKIRKDKINILFDLSGHTGKNRLPVFKYKPAPVQIAWGGYPDTTGIDEIDYIIGDNYVLPINEKSNFNEKIIRLRNIWVCFPEPEFDIKINSLPANKNGYITFGSFNNLLKINEKLISLWSKVLISVPNSKIFLKGKALDNTTVKNNIFDQFKKNKVSLDSIILEGPSSRENFLKSYNKVDISLDTFPYSGGVTSFESIWMGVPVVTKKGERFVSRTTESINSNLGIIDLIASSDEEYIDICVKYAKNYDDLSNLRKTLRTKALQSSLFDGKKFAENFEKKLIEVWDNFIDSKKSPDW